MRDTGMSGIGMSVKRLEDGPLLRGQGCFAADFNAPGQVHMRVVRSPVAFGRILAVEIDDAVALPGVLAVWTIADVDDLPPIDFRMTRIEGLAPYRQHVLARDYVRYVGEPVAVVFAVDPYVAEDAADLVFCDVDELDAVLDPLAAPSAFKPDTMPGFLSEPAVVRKGYGDLDAAFADAHRVIELEVKIGRHSGVPMETRGALAVFDAARDVLTMYGAARCPTTTATPSPACWAAIPRGCNCRKAMSAAASASAASSIPKTCWSAPPPCASACR
ncbi:6-hydroxypseudooxynicotine dehydrogenase complex subunit gamma [Methylobrevis pamukkalensis]|uniref:6-hydroxypseudooxynicotine dehydrogenase complex subunit gamma n=1 Tax=Methylobrevis pamukkalensis TaxID=1439726 RepID=A0A1E3HA15_9HYPH|nr:molybdopterin cofactor-binding domain-containing protein [Methylobrevis pamukkalensis]ODN72321.1 6-hydroxypseudooxynicotine dehydrogenase complex subunit gamma [Methylobrevis pamukkalensis]